MADREQKIKSLKDHDQDWISVQQAADYLAVSKRHVQRQIQKGALHVQKFGGAQRILITSFRSYVGSTDDPAGRE